MRAVLGRLGRPLNPVLARELRQRMRGRWAPVVLTLYLSLLAGVLHLVHGAYVRTRNEFDLSQAGAMGRTLFQTLLFFMLMLLCFLVPGLSSGAVAGERERQTLVPLQVTLLKPRSIVLGKLLASLAFVLLLLVATLPLISVSLIIGGVGLPEVVRAMGILLLTGVLLAAISVCVSTLLRRVQAATVVSYGLTFVLLFGTALAYGAQLIITRQGVQSQPQGILMLNPIVAVADVIGGRHHDLFGGGSPFTPVQELLQERDRPSAGNVNIGADVRQIGPGGDQGFVGFAPQPQQVPDGRDVPVWVWSVTMWSVIIAGSLVIASRRLRAPASTVGT